MNYRDRPNHCQCSMCFQFYSFNEYLKLDSEWIYPDKTQYGKTAICKCGARFHKHKWAIMSRKDNYIISTTHLEIGHSSVTDWTDHSSAFFYETMIFQYENSEIKGSYKPMDYQMRYKTMEEAIEGHKKVLDKIEDIILHPQDYPMGVIPMFCNAYDAAKEQKKTIQSDVKERLK